MPETTEREPQSRLALPGLLLIIALLTLYRWWVLTHHGFTLYIDEAYYWTWSRHLDWGYFSKPPVIAVIIASTTGLCGDSAVCVRIGALIIHPLTALLLFFLGRRLFGATAGFWAAFVYLSMPGMAMSSLIISTDVALMLFWSAALYTHWRALESGHWGWWLAAALALGLGLMSKYNMALFGLFSLLYLVLSTGHRGWWRDWRPWAATAVALAVFTPNLWWNLVHDFPTLRHTAHISKLNQSGLKPGELAGFFFAQFGVFGPILFGTLLWIGARGKELWHDERHRYLLLFSLPFLAIICVQALLGRAHANWAAPTYAGGAVLVAGWLLQHGQRRLLIAGVLLNLVIGSVLYHYETLARAAGIELNQRNDPYLRLRGWDEFGRRMQALNQANPDAVFLSHSRTLLSHLAYELRLPDERLAAWNPNGDIDHQFDISHDLIQRPAQTYLYVTDSDLPGQVHQAFESVEQPIREEIPILRGHSRRFQVYRLAGFLGYPEGG